MKIQCSFSNFDIGDRKAPSTPLIMAAAIQGAAHTKTNDLGKKDIDLPDEAKQVTDRTSERNSRSSKRPPRESVTK